MLRLSLLLLDSILDTDGSTCKQTSLSNKQPNGAFLFISYTPNHHQVSVKLPWQEWNPLHLIDPGPIHIRGAQEKAERLISRFKGKPDRPPKVITMHFVVFPMFCHQVLLGTYLLYAYVCTSSNYLFRHFLFSLWSLRKSRPISF